MRAIGTRRGGTTAKRVIQTGLKHTAAARDRLWPQPAGIVALLYHRVGGRSAAAEIDLPAAVFDEQMARLREMREPVSIDDALVALEGAAPARPHAIVTFDDGTADFVDVVLPIVVRHRIPVVLYVATAFIDEQRAFPAGGTPVSWAGLRDAVSTGLVTIGSHTHTHRLLDRAAPAEVADELDRSIASIAEQIGSRPAHFAYPKAVAPSTGAAEAVRSRFASAAVAGTRPNAYGAADPWRLARSPIQTGDGMRFFERKVAGGMALEDDVRRLANRVRYAGATS